MNLRQKLHQQVAESDQYDTISHDEFLKLDEEERYKVDRAWHREMQGWYFNDDGKRVEVKTLDDLYA